MHIHYTMRCLRNVFALIALSCLAGAPAVAAEPSPAWNDLLAVEGHLGLGTPLGLAGLALDLTPHPLVSVNVGAGRGLKALQIAAMARVRPFFPKPGLALGIGAGVSGGDTGTLNFMDSRELYFEKATWLNGEVFLEVRRGHFHLRPFLGLARRVWYSSCTYTDSMTNTSEPCSVADPRNIAIVDGWRTIFYTGIAVGFALL